MGVLVLDLVKNLKNCDNCVYNIWIRVRCQICSDSPQPRLDKPPSQDKQALESSLWNLQTWISFVDIIFEARNKNIFVLCQDSFQRFSDIRVLSHGTVCQLRPSRPIRQLTTFILLKKIEVSIRENNCRTKTRWNRPETAEDANNTLQLAKQRGKVKSFDVSYFYCHFWPLYNDDR